MPSVYRPRRPRASPLWQIVHHAWQDFLAGYETAHRKTHGPLRPDTVHVVGKFYRCGDLSAGFTRLQCPDCGHEKLLAFTCKGRHFCPSCHQRRVRQTGHWIAHTLCHDVPHRQFVFTMPRPLRGIFRKRRHLLDLLYRVAIESLRDWFRERLDLPDGQLAAIAAVQTSPKKITWVEKTKRVIYRSSRSWRTKRNFEVFTATGFLAAAVEHIPPKNQHTVRYYGRYSNKCRGMEVQAWEGDPADQQPATVPPPPAASARNLRPLWRNLILQIWGEDPLLCPCCKGLMKVHGTLSRPEEMEFFLRLHGMWEGIIDIPPPPEPPYDIETMEPIRVPALFRWASDQDTATIDASEVPWEAPELALDDERILVLDGDPGPPDEFCGS